MLLYTFIQLLKVFQHCFFSDLSFNTESPDNQRPVAVVERVSLVEIS